MDRGFEFLAFRTVIVKPQRMRDGIYAVLPASSTAARHNDPGSFVRIGWVLRN